MISSHAAITWTYNDSLDCSLLYAQQKIIWTYLQKTFCTMNPHLTFTFAQKNKSSRGFESVLHYLQGNTIVFLCDLRRIYTKRNVYQMTVLDVRSQHPGHVNTFGVGWWRLCVFKGGNISKMVAIATKTNNHCINNFLSYLVDYLHGLCI